MSENDEDDIRLAPFNPTSDQVQDIILRHMNLKATDILFDLGCGDGRLLINAAQRVEGLRCVGIEMDRKFVNRAKNVIKNLPVSVRNRIEIREGDVAALAESASREAFYADEIGSLCRNLTLFDATAVYIFLLPKGILKLKKNLDRLLTKCKEEQRSLQVVTYLFQIHDWEPTFLDRNTKSGSPMYIYRFN